MKLTITTEAGAVVRQWGIASLYEEQVRDDLPAWLTYWLEQARCRDTEDGIATATAAVLGRTSETVTRTPPPTSTVVPYTYRDMHNYKAHAVAIFAGVITDDERAVLQDALQDGEFFTPGAVGLEDAREVDSSWTGEYDEEIDHNLNEIHLDEIEVGTLPPTDERTISEFVAALEDKDDE